MAIYAFMKLFKYWKLSEGQDTDIPSKSPELFTRPAGPAFGKETDLEKNETSGQHMPQRVCWPPESAGVDHRKDFSPRSNETGMTGVV